ncbi:MAG: bifunctional isocitrate dehydrogenase kinase/phosphatase [Desulfobacterales bacterium]|nr:bifunctional isocitrate dehydrogenase kinase/phosphatase [Desulfobacterales bacterium]
MTDPAGHITAAALDGFAAYRRQFSELTQRARIHFRRADWHSMRKDAARRLDVYQRCLDQAVDHLHATLPAGSNTRTTWRQAKARFEKRATTTTDPDLAETFFNSISRRMLETTGIGPDVEFVRSQTPPLPSLRPGVDCRTYTLDGRFAEALVEEVLRDSDLNTAIADPAGDARRIARRLQRQGITIPAAGSLTVLSSVFYRGMGAYLIGCLTLDAHNTCPLAIAFVHRDGRVAADGLIADERGIRILFSYTHSYFLAVTENVGGLIGFLQKLMPRRRRAELYISLGYNRHGKTELYRDLTQHQNACRDIFEISPGKKGMVMAVFNMPSDDLVFKVIRDRFAKPKRTTRREVIAKYDYIYRHDRTGRLPDTQTFEHLKFDAGCFHPDVLEELHRTAARSVAFNGDELTLKFVYVERRVMPLDVYLQTAAPQAAAAAVIDFGQAIRDMAASNIFPGDMLIKNFGVTELGRVIFYDYDEVCPLTVCRFRRRPRSHAYADELSAAPLYLVGENDIFPEEFHSFLGLEPALRDVFLEHHADIFTPAFWQAHQNRIASGDLAHVYPYKRFERDHT